MQISCLSVKKSGLGKLPSIISFDAIPVDRCFEIIEQGSGTDFDPEIVKVFIEARPKVEEIYNRLK